MPPNVLCTALEQYQLEKHLFCQQQLKLLFSENAIFPDHGSAHPDITVMVDRAWKTKLLTYLAVPDPSLPPTPKKHNNNKQQPQWRTTPQLFSLPERWNRAELWNLLPRCQKARQILYLWCYQIIIQNINSISTPKHLHPNTSSTFPLWFYALIIIFIMCIGHIFKNSLDTDKPYLPNKGFIPCVFISTLYHDYFLYSLFFQTTSRSPRILDTKENKTKQKQKHTTVSNF